MIRTVWRLVVVLGIMLAVGLAISSGQAADIAVNEEGLDAPVQARLVVDGKATATAQRVSGLKMETEVIEYVCPSGGVDDDCDGTDSLVWQKDVRQALGELLSAVGALENGAYISGRAKHDIAMNSIRNVKAMVAGVEDTLNSPAATMKTKHDTVKNAIGNIRAAVRVYSEITVNEEGVNRAPEREAGSALSTLQTLSDSYTVRKRPGRTTFSNITLERGLTADTALYDWYQQVAAGATGRKPVSIIMVDRAGKELATYNLFECWPVAYAVDGGVERIELAVEKVERAGK